MEPRDVYGIWVTSGIVNATTLVFRVATLSAKRV